MGAAAALPCRRRAARGGGAARGAALWAARIVGCGCRAGRLPRAPGFERALECAGGSAARGFSRYPRGKLAPREAVLNNASREQCLNKLRERGVCPIFQVPGLPEVLQVIKGTRTRARAAFPPPRARAEVPPGHTCILPPPPAAARRGQANTPRTRQTAQDGRQPVRPPHLEGPAVHGADAHRLQSAVRKQLHEGK